MNKFNRINMKPRSNLKTNFIYDNHDLYDVEPKSNDVKRILTCIKHFH